MARTELSEVIEKIRRQVLDSHRTEVNTLDGLMDDDEIDVTVPLTYALSDSLVAGSIISIGTEDMRVMAVDASAKELTVIRGWGDSDVDAHDTDDVVWIQPRFTGQDIADALRDEITSWGPSLYRVYGDTHAIGDSAQTLELPVAYAGMYGFTAVARFVTQPAGSDPTSSVTAWPRAEIRFQRGTTSWDAATTSGLFVRFIEVTTASSVYLEAALPFDVAQFDTPECDLVDDVGIPESCLDLAVLGAKLRLLVDAEAERSSRRVADDPRRSEEVPPQTALQSANAYQLLYRRRMADEISRLHTLHPIRIT